MKVTKMILFKAYIWIILYRCSCKPFYYCEWDTYQFLFKYSKVDNILIIFIMNIPLYSDTIKIFIFINLQVQLLC